MAILDISKMTEAELDALPCVCCGYPLGVTPSESSYWICPQCNWEENADQFQTPWCGGGPNGLSLWESRRNFRFTGSMYHAEKSRIFAEPEAKLFSWNGRLPPSCEQYCWESDPNMYADYAGISTCPIIFSRDVLRTYGAFSGRQVLQKVILTGLKVSEGSCIDLQHCRVYVSPRQALVRRVVVDVANPFDDSAEFVKRLRQVNVAYIQDCGIEFEEETWHADNESLYLGSGRESWGDGINYWYKLLFSKDELKQVEIMASADGMSSFVELDKDRSW